MALFLWRAAGATLAFPGLVAEAPPPTILWLLANEEQSMSLRDRRSQRIRDQIRAHANPRSGQTLLLAKSLPEQLKRIYGGESQAADLARHDPVAAELARLVGRRR